MIVLTGTTGNLGSRVLTSLLQSKLLDPSELIVSSSNADKVPAIAKDHGVNVRHGDFENPESLQAAFEGADALFLVSYPSPSIERWLLHKNAIDAAKQAGIKTVIYASLMFGGETGMQSVAGADPLPLPARCSVATSKCNVATQTDCHSCTCRAISSCEIVVVCSVVIEECATHCWHAKQTHLQIMPQGTRSCTAGVQQAHIKTIEYLQQSGLKYVVVREGIYAESWWLYAGFQPQAFKAGDTSELTWVFPQDGPFAWVTWDDLGPGTANIVANYKQYIGQTLRLTGPRTTTLAQVAKLVEQQTGRKVNLKPVGKVEAARDHKEKGSVPESMFWMVDSWSGWHEGVANGEAAVVDPLLGQLLGRQPRGMKEMADVLFKPQ